MTTNFSMFLNQLGQDLFRVLLDAGRPLLELGQYDRAQLGAPEGNPWAEAVFAPPAEERAALGAFFATREGGDVCIPPRPLLPFSDPQRFAAKKPHGTYRVFLLGSSAAKAWCCNPYFTLAKTISKQLGAAYPGRKIEVIDCALARRNSFDMAVVAEQVAELEPDLLVVYEGNNEMQNYSLVHASYEAAMPEAYYSALWRVLSGKDPGARASVAGLVRSAFSKNMHRIAASARAAGARALFVASPSNLEFEPSLQLSSDQLPDAMSGWLEQLRSAERRESTDPAGTLATYEKLLERAESAGIHFRIGRVLRKLGDTKRAHQHLLKAKDLDQSYSTRSSPRTTTALVDALREVCADEGALFLDAVQAFEKASPDGIPGYGLFIDYCHLAIEGHKLMSTCIVERVVAERLVDAGSPAVSPGSPAGKAASVSAVTDDVLGLTPQLHASVWLNAALQSMIYMPTSVQATTALLRRAIDHHAPVAEVLRDLQRFILRRCNDTAYATLMATWQRVLGETFHWRGYLSLNLRKDWWALAAALEQVTPLPSQEREALCGGLADYFFSFQAGTIFAATEPFLIGPGLPLTSSDGPTSTVLLPYRGMKDCSLAISARALEPGQEVHLHLDGELLETFAVSTDWTTVQLTLPGKRLGTGLHRLDLHYRFAIAETALGRYRPEENDSGGARAVIGYHLLLPNPAHKAIELRQLTFGERATGSAYQPVGMDIAIVPAVLPH